MKIKNPVLCLDGSETSLCDRDIRFRQTIRKNFLIREKRRQVHCTSLYSLGSSLKRVIPLTLTLIKSPDYTSFVKTSKIRVASIRERLLK